MPEQSMVYFGIDPGITGGIAVVDASGHMAAVERMPDTAGGLADVIRRHARYGATDITLEYVHSQPGQGHSGAFTFGRGLGRIEGVLETMGFSYSTVVPAVWQRRMGCLTGGNKNISKARAQAAFPAMVVTHWNADALLIALYGRLVRIKLQSVRQPRQQ